MSEGGGVLFLAFVIVASLFNLLSFLSILYHSKEFLFIYFTFAVKLYNVFAVAIEYFVDFSLL